MKYLLFALSLVFVSCNNVDWKKVFPRSTFESAFPKKNKDLSAILGSRLVLKLNNDTLRLKISSKGDLNLITMEKGGDTMFCGTASIYRGICYLSQKINDTSYWIFAVKSAGDELYGINGMLGEELKMDEAALSGKYPKLVKYISKDTAVIRLHTDKKLIARILGSYIDSLKPYTVLPSGKSEELKLPPAINDSDKIMPSFEGEGPFKLISSVFPNPSSDMVTVRLQDQDTILYKLMDMSGEVIKSGVFLDIYNKIDISDMKSGIHILTASTSDGKISESVRVIRK